MGCTPGARMLPLHPFSIPLCAGGPGCPSPLLHHGPGPCVPQEVPGQSPELLGIPWLCHSKGLSLPADGGARGARLCLRAPWSVCWVGQSPGTSHLFMPGGIYLLILFFFFFSFLALARRSLDGFLGPKPIWDSWKQHSNNSKYLNYNYFHLSVFVYLLFQESSSSTQNSFIVIEISSPLWFEESCADSVQQSLRKSL